MSKKRCASDEMGDEFEPDGVPPHKRQHTTEESECPICMKENVPRTGTVCCSQCKSSGLCIHCAVILKRSDSCPFCRQSPFEGRTLGNSQEATAFLFQKTRCDECGRCIPLIIKLDQQQRETGCNCSTDLYMIWRRVTELLQGEWAGYKAFLEIDEQEKTRCFLECTECT